MNTDFEPVMAAQFAALEAAATLNLVADAAANSPTLSAVTNFTGLFPGLPVFGPGVLRGATILSLDPGASTLTLTDPVSAAATGAMFTTGFLTTARRLQQVSVDAQPGLYFRRIGATDTADDPFVTTTLECEAYIYSNAGQNPNAVPDTMLGCLEQMVRNSFIPVGADKLDGRFTLGGLVYWSRIEGRSVYSPGDQAGQAISRIPIRITLP